MPDHESRNIEVKASCPSLETARRAAIQLGATDAGTFEQTDTYFVVQRGRFKLRQIRHADRSDAELIFYDRANESGPRLSRYHRIAVLEAERLNQVLGTALGVASVVRKRRTLLLWHNVRIHLDDVENLGNFIELEAVIGHDADETISTQRIDQLLLALGIPPQDRIAKSYGELVQCKDAAASS